MAKQLHEKQQDLDLDLQNKHFVETPAGVVKYVTTEQLHGGLKFEDYSITRNLERGVNPASFTNYTTAAGLGNNVCNAVYVFGNNVYVATNGGVSISTDGGITYTNYTTANGLGNNVCNDIFVVQNNVYVATNGGVSISSDAGLTYTNYTTANGLNSNTCTDIYVDGNNIYVVNSAVSRSINGGTSYSTLFNIGTNINDVYAYGTTIYILTDISSVPAGGLYKSIDNGTTFTRIWAYSGSFISPTLHSLFVNDNNIYITHQDLTHGGGISL